MRILKSRPVDKLAHSNFCHHLHYPGASIPDKHRFPAGVGGWRCRHCKYFNGVISNSIYLYVKCSYKGNFDETI